MKPGMDVDDGHDDAAKMDDAFWMIRRACDAGDRTVPPDVLHLVDAVAILSGARTK